MLMSCTNYAEPMGIDKFNPAEHERGRETSCVARVEKGRLDSLCLMMPEYCGAKIQFNAIFVGDNIGCNVNRLLQSIR